MGSTSSEEEIGGDSEDGMRILTFRGVYGFNRIAV
jgi:hypothetical protein